MDDIVDDRQRREVNRRKVEAQLANLYREFSKPATKPELINKLACEASWLWSDNPQAGRAQSIFREVSFDRTYAELKAIADGRDITIGELHQPTILALANCGCLVFGAPPNRQRMAASAAKALMERDYLTGHPRHAIRQLRKPGKGAPVNNLHNIMRVLVRRSK